MARTLIVAFHKCLELTPDLTLPPLAQLHYTWALVHVGEYIQTICALTLSTLVTLSDETMGVLRLSTHLLKLISPLLLMIFILRWKLL